MSLRRKAMVQMEEWKLRKTRQALLVSGARQVGKTYLIREFARAHYGHLVEINLVDRPEAAQAMANVKSADQLFLRISAFADAPLVPYDTLVFIDEVQECPEIITALKFLIDRYGAELDFVVSGSLLGIEMYGIRSLPVGYLDIVDMYPLDLEEFCWATGVPSVVLDEARSAFAELRSVDPFVHERLEEAFHNYAVVGGMPDAVQAFVDSNNMQTVRHLQEGVLELYRRDISKYAGARARTVRRIYDLVPSELNTQSKRFAIGHIEGSSRFNRYDNDFMWLADAGVVLPTYNVDEPRYPLELSADSSFFKLFMSDVGLLTCACGMDVVRDLMNDRIDINYGSIYENYTAQEFAAHGLCHPAPDLHLYFFRNRKMGELDFVAESPRGRVVPIEVKSGKSYRRHSALDNVLEVPNYGIEEAIVLHEGNVEVEGRIRYLPLYMTMFLERSAV